MLRKKRITMTEQAQAAISAGMPVDQALAELGTPDPAAEELELPTTAEATEGEVPEEETTEEEVTEEEPAEDVAPEGAAPVVALKAESGDSAFNSILDRLQVAQNTIATQAAQITGMTASAEVLTTQLADFMKIVVKNVNHMQIALGGAATDMSHLDAANLLAQYQSTLTTFEKRLPVGGKAEVPLADEDREGKVVPLVNPGVARATQFRK